MTGLVNSIKTALNEQGYPVVCRDLDYNILYANGAAGRAFGMQKKGDGKGLKCYQAFHGLNTLPDECYCGHDNPDLKTTMVYNMHTGNFMEHIFMPLSRKGNLVGSLDVFNFIKPSGNPNALEDPSVLTVSADGHIATGMCRRHRLQGLTNKEGETLGWIKKGRSPAEISRQMSITENTVNFHIKNIFNKLGADNRAHAVAMAYEADLGNRELLFRELNHRVKNNFTILGSMINLQGGKIEDAPARKALRNINNMVRNFASLHYMLMDAANSTHVPARAYLGHVIEHVKPCIEGQPCHITVEYDIDDILLHMNTAIPCASIISELVSNAIEHAFVGLEKGLISVSFKCIRDTGGKPGCLLTVRDNGIGIPDGFDARKGAYVGMKIINALVAQLDGSMGIINNKGTEFTITLQGLAA